MIPRVLLTLTPSVDTLLMICNSRRGGWQDGVISSIAICRGLFVDAFVSAVAISLILLHFRSAFTLLNLFGARLALASR